MLVPNGAQALADFSAQFDKETVTQVTDGVWFASGLGLSNSIFIEGTTGVILIDTLDTLERGKRLSEIIRECTNKEVKTIIYTHGHPDHTGGAGAFQQGRPEIVAFAPLKQPLEKTELLLDTLNKRAVQQFGYFLSDKEIISQGTGPREGISYGEHRAILPPTTLYQQAQVSRAFDGVEVELVRLPGETEDHAMIWLPRQKVLCCGDNYYGCFPNLYAIRGGEYRSIAAWVNSLGTLLSYPAEYLLPGHTEAVIGREAIQTTLENYRDAMDYILTETLEGINRGGGPEELAAGLRLPGEYADLSYLGEYYGCVEWTVREIYAAYVGWFDGNPTNLHPLAPKVRAEKMLELMGGRRKLLAAAQGALLAGEYQWCMELCDLLLSEDAGNLQALEAKAEALQKIAEYETSANGRHYYISCAKELQKRIQSQATEEAE